MADAAAAIGAGTARSAASSSVVLGLILRRSGLSLLLLLAVSVVVFAGTELLPGDVAQILY